MQDKLWLFAKIFQQIFCFAHTFVQERLWGDGYICHGVHLCLAHSFVQDKFRVMVKFALGVIFVLFSHLCKTNYRVMATFVVGSICVLHTHLCKIGNGMMATFVIRSICVLHTHMCRDRLCSFSPPIVCFIYKLSSWRIPKEQLHCPPNWRPYRVGQAWESI